MANHPSIQRGMISLDVRQEQLAHLVETLRDLLSVVGRDPHCPFSQHVERSLSEAEALLHRPFTQQDLNALSSSVCSVYDARRRLGDYQPPSNIPDAENFSTYASVAYERALELRAI
jgi:hypothetical protein